MKIRYLLVLFLTAGIFWACQTINPHVRDAQLALQIMDYEGALESVERALEEDSTNALAHYYKGYALGAMAQDIEPPSDRKPRYEEMRESMTKAKRFADEMESRPSEIDEIDDFIIELWAFEHNFGAQVMTDDSTRQATENPDETARAHFENAITIEPDSSISYIVLSSVQYQLGDMEEATRTYETAMAKMDEPVYEDYEFLISLYFMQNRFEDARDLSLEAMDAFPDQSIFAQFLADTYLETGETEKAMQTLRDLIETDPENPQFHFALGTQLYRNAQEQLDEVSNLYQRAYQMEEQMSQLSASEQEELRREADQIRSEAEQFEREGNEIAEQAVEKIKTSIELSAGQEDDNAYNILGIIYQNKAAALFDKRNNTRDNELAREFDEEARENLVISKDYYEQAARLNPDEPDYWQSLFQVYTTLGMDEEAEEAMRRAGLDDAMN